MSQHPAGFMSYVRFEDQHENGRLTEFCARLSGEVRIQTGERFHIFQDRNDIAWGQQWQERINESLDAVTFLVPIITPGFFKSVACREELQRFLDREQSLKRADLILPVYYVNCPILNDEARRAADGLAQVIAARQFADFRELRFEPFTSPDVARALARMAGHIVESLERNQPQTVRAMETAPSPQATLRETATSASQEAAPSPKTGGGERGPTAKTEPPTRVVDALHRGDHPTLTAALEAAKPGDRILVRPGLYREGVVIDKPVEIIGDGELGEVVIEAVGKNAVLFKASMGRISNLMLRQAGGGDYYCVNITQGRLDLEGCDITSQSNVCVAIHGGADPRLRRNRIHDGKAGGVMVYENGQGTLEDNDIFANAMAGVVIKEGASPILRRNRIHDGKSGGVHVYENGQGTLEDNEIFANALAGVEIRETSNPTLRRNRIHDGKSAGVLVCNNGQGTLEDNDIFANAFAGVEIREGANPTLRRNRVNDGSQSGVLVQKNGQGTLEGNDIFANALWGVAIKEGANAILRRNRIHDNGSHAVRIRQAGGGVFENNDLRGNKLGAWDIAADCADKVKSSGNQE